MTELTNAQLHQIRQALITGVDLTMYRVDTDTNQAAASEIQAALDIVTKLLEAPAAKVEAAPVAAKAKTVKLSAAQMKLAIRVDCSGTLRIPTYGREAITAAAMVKKGLLEITEPDGVWGNYYGLTDAGYDAMGND